MSWFTGERLSNQLTSFKDQITTFTRDVLTETTDEIEGKKILFNEHSLACVDPVGELRLAKQRIDELEKIEYLQKDEVCIIRSCKFYFYLSY